MPHRAALVALFAVVLLAASGPARAVPTEVVIEETIFFSSGDQASLFPPGQPFRITYTYEPETPDLDGVVNGGGAFPGSISAMTIELAGLVFEYGGGATSNVLTSDDQGLAPFLTDGVVLLPGSHVSGTLDGLVPTDLEVEAALIGAAPDMIVDDVLQPAFAYDFVSVTFDTIDGSDILTTVVSTDPGATVPEPSLAALAASAGMGLLGRRLRARR